MFKFGVKTKEAKWDRWNPTLEEMKSNYIKTIRGLFYMLGELVLNTKITLKIHFDKCIF